jgi:superfamily I DNA/RNA helicase
MQWMVPKNRLGQTQLYVLDRCLRQQRVWIQGFAGSGKTVLLVHALREALAANPQLNACVVVYTYALKDLVSTGLPEHLAGKVPVMTYNHFLKNPKDYDLIVVDEVQDLEKRALKAVARHASRVIVAGDGDQSIYGNRMLPKDLQEILSPETHKLEVLYRLTETLKLIVRTILPHSQIETARVDRMVANVDIRLAQATDLQAEVTWVWREAMRYCRQGDPVAVLLPKKALIQRFIDVTCETQGKRRPAYMENFRREVDYNMVNFHLEREGLGLRYLGNNFGQLSESDAKPVIYLMTYHSAKGLDFDTVFLPHLDYAIEFWNDDDELARRLFFVATTRSRRNLFMSYHGHAPHRYITAMPQNLLKTVEVNHTESAGVQDVDIF